jgi:hypothetical protein
MPETRFTDIKEIWAFLRDLKAKYPNYQDWDKDDDRVLWDVNLDGLFLGGQTQWCDKAAFLDDDSGNVVSFAIINASKVPAIHAIYTPGPFREKRYAYRLVEDCVRHIVQQCGEVGIIYDEQSDGSTRIKERLPPELAKLLKRPGRK